MHQIAIALADAYRDLGAAYLVMQDSYHVERAAHAATAERLATLANAALGCSEGMACRRPVWFGCCATRKRICEALGVEFHVEPQGSSGSSVIDDATPQGATVPGEGT